LSSTSSIGSVIGSEGEGKDGGIGRVDLVVNRWIGQVLGQDPGGDVESPPARPGRRCRYCVSRLNWRVMVLTPKELTEFIEVSPLICPNCCSNGVVTEETITSGAAPAAGS